jgi:hypothetical protein
MNHVRGINNKMLHSLKEESGAVKVHIDENGSSLIVIGNEESLSNLELLLETHINFFKQKQM